MTQLNDLTLVETIEAVRSRTISCVELVNASIRACEQEQPRLNCVIRLNQESALVMARKADAALAAGRTVGPLHGVPLAHKDMFYRAGTVTTCGSKIRRDFVSDSTATVLKRLDAAGAIEVARLNMSEFAYS